jgi:hypothetical protein
VTTVRGYKSRVEKLAQKASLWGSLEKVKSELQIPENIFEAKRKLFKGSDDR